MKKYFKEFADNKVEIRMKLKKKYSQRLWLFFSKFFKNKNSYRCLEKKMHVMIFENLLLKIRVELYLFEWILFDLKLTQIVFSFQQN